MGSEEMESTLLATAQTERRQYRRLAMRLPMEYSPAGKGEPQALRTTSSNISTGGLYFEVDPIEGISTPELNSLLNVSLTVPPGDGHFPYEGKVTGTAEVVRCDRLASPGGEAPARIGIGVRFREPLKLAF